MRSHALATAIATVCVASAAAPDRAHAQAETIVTTAVGVGVAHDDNVFWRDVPQEANMWRLSPRFDVERDAVRARWTFQSALDSEFFPDQPHLSTPAARQFVATRATWQVSDIGTVAVQGGYTNSVNPGDINVGTGLAAGRIRAWSWFGGAEYVHAVDGRQTLSAGYRLSGEDGRLYRAIVTDTGDVRYGLRLDGRHEADVRYTAELFRVGAQGTIVSHRATAGIRRALSPSTSVAVAAGLRFAEDDITPHVEVSLTNRRPRSESSLLYSRTQTTALGVNGLVDVQHVRGAVGYGRERSFNVSLATEYFRNAIGPTHAHVGRVAGEMVIPTGGLTSLALTYAYDRQFTRDRTASPSPVTIIDPAQPPVRRGDVQRNYVALRVVIGGRARFGAGPAEEPVDTRRPSPTGGR